MNVIPVSGGRGRRIVSLIVRPCLTKDRKKLVKTISNEMLRNSRLRSYLFIALFSFETYKV
jgi:hypothetical protein